MTEPKPDPIPLSGDPEDIEDGPEIPDEPTDPVPEDDV